ncbi:MAG: hypothetical protein ACE5DX_04715 [Candidatus Dojkabacteria bacterium]
MKKSNGDSSKSSKTEPNIKMTSPAKTALFVFVSLFAFYVLLVSFWSSTSPANGPENALDFAVKTPAEQFDWFIRRENGL